MIAANVSVAQGGHALRRPARRADRTGSTGLQAATATGKTAGHLYVIQRTPAYSPPANNGPLPPGYERDWEGSYPSAAR